MFARDGLPECSTYLVALHVMSMPAPSVAVRRVDTYTLAGLEVDLSWQYRQHILCCCSSRPLGRGGGRGEGGTRAWRKLGIGNPGAAVWVLLGGGGGGALTISRIPGILAVLLGVLVW